MTVASAPTARDVIMNAWIAAGLIPPYGWQEAVAAAYADTALDALTEAGYELVSA